MVFVGHFDTTNINTVQVQIGVYVRTYVCVHAYVCASTCSEDKYCIVR